MRKVEKINIEWAFLKGDTKDGKPPRRIKGDWEVVNLPHTWNALDGQDGGYDFYRDLVGIIRKSRLD